MDKLFGVIVGPRAELFDLLEHETPTLGLVPDLLVLVDDDEDVGLLVRGVEEELPGREREVVLCRNDEDDNIDLFLASEEGGRLERVAVKTGSIDERNVSDAVVEEGLGGRAGMCCLWVRMRAGLAGRRGRC